MSKNKSKMVTLPAATVAMLSNMFKSQDGVNMTAIIDDLGGNQDVTVINLGLLMRGQKLELPKETYYISDSRVCVYKLTHFSVLKDSVEYIKITYDKNSDGVWEKQRWQSTDSTNVEDWLDKLDELPESIKLPEDKPAEE